MADDQKLPEGAKYGAATAPPVSGSTLPTGAKYGTATAAPQGASASETERAAQPWRTFTSGAGFTPSNMLSNAATGFVGGLKGIYNVAAHPIDTYHADAAARAKQGEEARSNYDPAHPVLSTISSLGHSTAEALPLVGPWAASLGEQAGSGDVGGALSQGIGGYAGAKLGMKAVGSLSPVRVTPSEPTPVNIPGLPGAEVPSALPTVEFRMPPAVTFLKGAAADLPIVKGGLKAIKAQEAAAADARAAQAETARLKGVQEDKAYTTSQQELSRNPSDVEAVHGPEGQIYRIPRETMNRVRVGATQVAPEDVDAMKQLINANTDEQFMSRLKSVQNPNVRGVAPPTASDVMPAETQATAADYLKSKGITETPKVEQVAAGNDMMQRNQAPATSQEVNDLAQKEVEKMSPAKPVLEPKVEGQLRHVIGDYATDNLIETPEGAEVASRLRKLSGKDYMDIANELGVEKPKASSAKTGKAWSPDDFKRNVAEHGKELAPLKEMVIRHMVDKYGPADIMDMLGDRGK